MIWRIVEVGRGVVEREAMSAAVPVGWMGGGRRR